MTRDIVFRGKRTNNSRWVYGSYWHYHCSNTHPHFVFNDDASIWTSVDPDTVGQFTGLCDKNGVRIFEGDIIRWHDNTELSVSGQIAEVCYGEYIDADSDFDDVYSLGFYFKLFDEDKTCATINWLNEYKNDFDIIGNIYDNPEFKEDTE